MFKILDLFAGTQSVRKAFPNCDYKGIDIYSPEEQNIILDLTQDNIVEKLKEKIGNWKPNFIWASPVCTTFSRATSITNGTLAYEVKNNRVQLRQNWNEVNHKSYNHLKNDMFFRFKHLELGIKYWKILINTIKIIEYFKVPFAIENPSNAVSKYEYLHYGLIKNDTHYCQYEFKYKKATAIYSNKKINLLKCNHKKHEQVMSGWKSKTGIKDAPTSNKERSKVPPKLIKSIIEQLTLQD